MENLEIAKMLTVSTAHISEEMGEMLDDASNDGPLEASGFLSVYTKGTYGWLIYVHDVPETANVSDIIAEQLIPLIELAKQNQCTWLCLDCEGPLLKGFPRYQ